MYILTVRKEKIQSCSKKILPSAAWLSSSVVTLSRSESCDWWEIVLPIWRDLNYIQNPFKIHLPYNNWNTWNDRCLIITSKRVIKKFANINEQIGFYTKTYIITDEKFWDNFQTVFIRNCSYIPDSVTHFCP